MTRPHRPIPAWIPVFSLLTVGVSVSSTASAQEVVSAAQAGAGGASLADPRDNSEVTLNPANVSLIPRYDVQAQFTGGPTGDLRWNASAVDGRTSKFLSFGVAYHGGVVAPAFHPVELPGWAPTGEALRNRKQTHDITVALSAPFVDRKVAVGLNGTLMIFDGEYVGKGVSGNVDVGFSARPIEFFSVGLVGKNLLPIKDQAEIPAAIGLGVRGGKDNLFVGMVDFNTRLEQVAGSRFDVSAGIQGTIKELVDLRGGYAWDGDINRHAVTWGLGLHSKVGGIDYGMRIPVFKDAWTIAEATHYVALTIFTNFGDEKAEEQPIRWPGDR